MHNQFGKKIILVLLGAIFIGASGVTALTDYYGATLEPLEITSVQQNEFISLGETSEYEEDPHDVYLIMEEPMFIETSADSSLPQPLTSTQTLPAEFSWKNVDGGDWTTPAKNQGNCGSCWDFAEIAAFEATINIQEGHPALDPDLSEQYVLSCLSPSGSCRGRREGAYKYIMDTSVYGNNHNGVIPESCFPYQADDSIPCSEKCPDWEEKLIPIVDYGELWVGFDNEETRDVVKTYLMEYGPLATGINISTRFINWGAITHKSTDYFPYIDEEFNNYINHIILLVGWKDDPSIGRGGYWICKNSWGTDWGYDGLFNIEYGGHFTASWIEWVIYNPESYDWPPIADAGGCYEAAPNQEITFDGQESFDVEGDIVSFEWDFGDGQTGIGPTPTHSYEQLGVYETVLTVVDSAGHSSSDVALIGIDESPLSIDIKGGIGFTITISNPTQAEIFSTDWSVELDGMVFTLFTETVKSGVIDTLPAQGEHTLILQDIGFGLGAIYVTVDQLNTSARYLLLGPFTLVIG